MFIRLIAFVVVMTSTVVLNARQLNPSPLVVAPGSAGRSQFIAQAHRIFVRLDVHHQNAVSRGQIAAMVSDPRHPGAPRVPFFTESVPFELIDANKDGKITESEYVGFAAKMYDKGK